MSIFETCTEWGVKGKFSRPLPSPQAQVPNFGGVLQSMLIQTNPKLM
jgi:hypothetical protein